MFLNISSPLVAPIWGAYAHQTILRQFFEKSDLKLEISFDPYEKDTTDEPGSILSLLRGILEGIGIGFGYILVSMSIISNIVKEKEQNLKNQMRISGVSLTAYWLGHYLSDLIFSMIISGTIFLLIVAFDSDLQGTWHVILLLSASNTIFLYCVSALFN